MLQNKAKIFWYWINERHKIWMKRAAGQPAPWTKDKILQQYKFTNVFRQLDKTTVMFQDNILKKHNGNMRDILFNVFWFRMFGYHELTELGFVSRFEFVDVYIRNREKQGKQVFTGAYMYAADKSMRPKHIQYLEIIRDAYPYLQEGVEKIMLHNTMEYSHEWMTTIPFVGDFIGYEMVCDLRFSPVLENATDKLTWSNVGPGAKRGLLRLGMKPCLASMVELYNIAINEEKIELHVAEHLPWNDFYPPFELREIEHSLCEFDKYMRAKDGGRTKARYNGTGK
jgi:hypothetical protein